MFKWFCSNGFSELQNVNRKYFGIAASFYQIIGVDTWISQCGRICGSQATLVFPRVILLQLLQSLSAGAFNYLFGRGAHRLTLLTFRRIVL